MESARARIIDPAAAGFVPEEVRPEPLDARTPQQASEPDPPGTGNVEQIRDILFGVQMRDYEKRFSALETRLTKEAADLREDIRSRFDALELAMRQHIAALIESLAHEREHRTGAVQEVADHVRALTQDVDTRAAQLDTQARTNHDALRNRLELESRTLGDEIKNRFEALSATVEQHASTLHGAKADRTALASLFTEMARRLESGTTAPDAE
jgi:DNA repair exonuclease SbcCD ATPase subunit